MRVCLVRTSLPKNGFALYPPFGLVSMAPYFEGSTIAVHDENTSDSGFHYSNFDVIAFSALSVQLSTINKLIGDLKTAGAASKFIVGGAGVTSNPEYAAKLVPNADVLFAGDGEHFAQHPEKYLNCEMVDLRSEPFNLANKKMPTWDLIQREYYLKTVGLGVETSRGCPFNCFMCTAHMIHGKKWQSRKPEEVVSELTFLKEKYGCKKYYFADDNATADPQRWVTLMQQIADAKLNLELSVPEGIQAHHLDYETLRLMREAGLKEFTIGAESGSNRVLKEVIHKGGLTVEKIREVVWLAVQLNMKPSCFFIVGFPGETFWEAQKTVAFADELRHIGAVNCTVRNAVPIPGTEMFSLAKTKGYLTVPETQLFDFDFIHSGKHLLKTSDWEPEQIEWLVAKSKLQEGKHFVKSHPSVLFKHPRSSLKLLAKPVPIPRYPMKHRYFDELGMDDFERQHKDVLRSQEC